MNIAKRAVGCIGGLMIVAAVVVNGQALAADTKIGIIDMKKVVSTSTAGQKAQGVLEQKGKSLQESFKKDQDDILALEKEFEKKNSAWTDAVKKEKTVTYQKKRSDFATKQQGAQAEFKKLEEQQIAPVLKKIEEVVGKLAKDEGYSLILPRQVVYYTSDALDISDKVIAELNKAMK